MWSGVYTNETVTEQHTKPPEHPVVCNKRQVSIKYIKHLIDVSSENYWLLNSLPSKPYSLTDKTHQY